jgi:NADPH2:quinone reductase
MMASTPDEHKSPAPKCHRVVVSRHGGPEVLHLVEEEMPEPQAGEVRVRVLAAGVSGYDLMLRSSGTLPGTPKVPFTLGEDYVGLVDKLGEGATSVELGQTVAGFSFGDGGSYAEYICRPAAELVPVPPGLDPAEAVCLVVNYLTAGVAMHQTAKVKEGERVLVQGAGGGVGSALLDLGRLAGLEMYGTASAYNHELVSRLGATPIDYRNQDVVKVIRELTGDGVDAAFDPIGGAGQIRGSYRALRKGGRLVWFGMAATKDKGLRVIPFTLLMQGLLALFPDGRQAPLMPDLGAFSQAHEGWYRETLAGFFDLLGWYRETLAGFFDLLAEDKLKPAVAARFPLAEAARAHELLERGGYGGKVILVTTAQS